MRTPRMAALAAVLFPLLAPLVRAQDSHYWTNQYGTRATLLGGAVIGIALDLSGTYYNPGGMSLLEDPGTLMAAKVFHYPNVTLAEDGRGGIALNADNPGPAPSLLAGTIPIRGLRNHWFGYSYLARQEVDLGLSVSSTGQRDILPGIPGPESYTTQFRLDEKVAESWFGLTWSTRLAKGIGVGLSQYVAVRSHRVLTEELVEALTGDGRLAMAMGKRQFKYRNFRALWKLGVCCAFKDLTLGVTLTTPSLSIFGTGTTGVNETIVDLDMDGDGDADDYLASDYRDHLSSSYRTPVSLAAGMTFKYQQVRFYWSMEWYAPVRPYKVVDAAEFPAQSTGEMLSTDLTQELDSVINLGVGLEWLYSSKFKGYASFTTDDSAKIRGTATNLSLTDWNIHHLVTGAEFSVNKWELTMGLGFSFGARANGQRPPILDRAGAAGMWDPFNGLKYRYANYRLIFGFAI